MSKHTPGPWTHECVRTSSGIVHKIGPFPWNDGKQNHACIYGDYASAGPLAEELEANARLIAAAPDLLAALEEACASLAWVALGRCRAMEEPPIMPPEMAIDLARAAIAKAKAKGEA